MAALHEKKICGLPDKVIFGGMLINKDLLSMKTSHIF